MSDNTATTNNTNKEGTTMSNDNTITTTDQQLGCDINPNTPYCRGESIQGDEFTDTCTEVGMSVDYAASNEAGELVCVAEVELGEPQIMEREEKVELGEPQVMVRTTEVETLPETGAELGFGITGLLMLAAGITVLRRTRKA